MTKTIREALDYIEQVVSAAVPSAVQPLLLPAHTALAAVRDALPAGSPILLGAQNAHWGAEGAPTGEVSMRMVADAGAKLVELGHSERRQHFGEVDESVAAKVPAGLDAGFAPIICVGEPTVVRSAGDEEAFVETQVRAALSRVRPEEVAHVLFAYEPVWAIGTSGRAAEPEEVAPLMALVAELTAVLGSGNGCRALLYGGSVDQENAASLLKDPNMDGLFVGRAAWTADGFLRLLDIAGQHVESERRLEPHDTSPTKGTTRDSDCRAHRN